MANCGTCGGTRKTQTNCRGCNGRGQVSGRNHTFSKCGPCGGVGVINQTCGSCGGSGKR